MAVRLPFRPHVRPLRFDIINCQLPDERARGSAVNSFRTPRHSIVPTFSPACSWTTIPNIRHRKPSSSGKASPNETLGTRGSNPLGSPSNDGVSASSSPIGLNDASSSPESVTFTRGLRAGSRLHISSADAITHSVAGSIRISSTRQSDCAHLRSGTDGGSRFSPLARKVSGVAKSAVLRSQVALNVFPSSVFRNVLNSVSACLDTHCSARETAANRC
jgi:hypothetical protein